MVGRNTIIFNNGEGFRQKIVLAILSQKVISLRNIRVDAEEPGLTSYEVSFLKLVEKISNGIIVKINHSGTSVTIKPGVLVGGRIEHDCDLGKAIGYYLEPLIPLALFSKHPIMATLIGITNDNADVSVDLLRTVSLPLLNRFGVDDEATLKIVARGMKPLGGGKVEVRLPNVRQLKCAMLDDAGRIKKIRGIAYSARVSPQMANRCIDGAKKLLTRYIPDVYIYADIYKGTESGNSPGFGISLVAESTTGAQYATEVGFETKESAQSSVVFEVPEDMGEYASYSLLSEISNDSCIPSCCQWLAFLLVALGPEDVSTFQISALSDFTINYVRDIRKFLGVQFKIKTEPGSDSKLRVTGVGSGFVNMNKQTT